MQRQQRTLSTLHTEQSAPLGKWRQ